MGYVARQEVARGAHHLNRVYFNLDRFFHCGPPHRMAGDVEMICAACPVPEGVGLTNVSNVVLDVGLNPTNAHSLVVPEAGDGEGEVEQVRFGRVIC